MRGCFACALSSGVVWIVLPRSQLISISSFNEQVPGEIMYAQLLILPRVWGVGASTQD
jgi:hypothetical protein